MTVTESDSPLAALAQAVRRGRAPRRGSGVRADVGNDRDSKAAMLLALPQVTEEPLSVLREKRLMPPTSTPC